MLAWPSSNATSRVPPAGSGMATAELAVPKSIAQYSAGGFAQGTRL
jgi:hypothetical protein